MKKYLFIFFVTYSTLIFGQGEDDAYKYKTREIGLNATPFISTFISIGETSLKDQVAAFTFKTINAKNNAFRLGLGVQIENSGFGSDNSFHIRVGFEKRRLIKNNWWYYWGADILLNVEDALFEDPNPSFGSGFGLGPVFGLFYEINEMISLSTESSLYFIFADDTGLNIVPPISLFFNVRFKKMKRRYRMYERYKN